MSTSYAYCGQDHPGGDQEARQWCESYHRPRAPETVTPSAYDGAMQVPPCDRCNKPSVIDPMDGPSRGHLCARCAEDAGYEVPDGE